MGNKYAGTWTETRIDTLTAMWADGHPASVIGERMGLSRNAVLGKVDRLGLPKRRDQTGVRQRRIRERPARVGVANYIKQAKPMPKPVLAFDSAHVLPIIETRTFRKDGTNQCRWPVEDQGAAMLVCGSPTPEGGSYCPYHSGIAYKGLGSQEFLKEKSYSSSRIMQRAFGGAR